MNFVMNSKWIFASEMWSSARFLSVALPPPCGAPGCSVTIGSFQCLSHSGELRTSSVIHTVASDFFVLTMFEL